MISGSGRLEFMSHVKPTTTHFLNLILWFLCLNLKKLHQGKMLEERNFKRSFLDVTDSETWCISHGCQRINRTTLYDDKGA